MVFLQTNIPSQSSNHSIDSNEPSLPKEVSPSQSGYAFPRVLKNRTCCDIKSSRHLKSHEKSERDGITKDLRLTIFFVFATQSLGGRTTSRVSQQKGATLTPRPSRTRRVGVINIEVFCCIGSHKHIRISSQPLILIRGAQICVILRCVGGTVSHICWVVSCRGRVIVSAG